jgi:hypothetical protein
MRKNCFPKTCLESLNTIEETNKTLRCQTQTTPETPHQTRQIIQVIRLQTQIEALPKEFTEQAEEDNKLMKIC